jgi:hypothetical protein
MLLTADPENIWGVGLVDAEVAPLYRAPSGHELVVNRSAEEAIQFCGVALGEGCYVFLTRQQNRGDAILNLRYFSEGSIGKEVLRLAGEAFVGPVIEAGLIAICSDRSAAVYKMGEQKSLVFEFKNFKPQAERSLGGVNIAPGGMPLWAGAGERGLEMRVAGTRGGQAGWLRIYFERQYAEFESLPAGSSISHATPKGLILNMVSAIQGFGAERNPTISGPFEPGMPVAFSGANQAYFDPPSEAGIHQISVNCGARMNLRLKDPDCNAASCCGFQFSGPFLVVNYLVSSKAASGKGLRIAFWRLAPRGLRPEPL